MVYILHQRLNAQKVAKDKEDKVLREVIAAMHDKSFITELFDTQEVYDIESVKQIFDKIAHSSLMRLNSSSMSKLFDLMLMGMKHQLMNCLGPWDVLHMTLIHIRSMRNLITESSDPNHSKAVGTLEALSFVEDKFSENFRFGGPHSSLPSMMILKKTLHDFFLGKKVKASLFLQRRQQVHSGDFVLTNEGPLPRGTEPPGSIKVFKNKRPVRVYDVRLSMPAFVRSRKPAFEGPWNPEFHLGCNVYSINNSRFCLSDPRGDDEMGKLIHARLVDLIDAPGSRSSGAVTVKAASLTPEAARAEAKLTSSLLGGSMGRGGGAKESNASLPALRLMTILNEHAQANDEDGSGPRGGRKDDSSEIINVVIEEIDAQADAKTLDDMLDHLDLKDVSAKADSKSGANGGGGYQSGGAEDSDDDLLALMDSVK